MAISRIIAEKIWDLRRAGACRGGDVLTLGRQEIEIDTTALTEIIVSRGICKIAGNQIILDADFQNKLQRLAQQELLFHPQRGLLLDKAFFELAGFTSQESVDFSRYEECDWVHDLNQPHSRASCGNKTYDLIIDTGTTEHIFDTVSVLKNIFYALREGGTVLHHLPTNNYVNHGYFQISPLLLTDYYALNGFEILEVRLDRPLSDQRPGDRVLDPYPQNMSSEEIATYQRVHNLLTMFIARKLPGATCDKIPNRSRYTNWWEAHVQKTINQ